MYSTAVQSIVASATFNLVPIMVHSKLTKKNITDAISILCWILFYHVIIIHLSYIIQFKLHFTHTLFYSSWHCISVFIYSFTKFLYLWFLSGKFFFFTSRLSFIKYFVSIFIYHFILLSFHYDLSEMKAQHMLQSDILKNVMCLFTGYSCSMYTMYLLSK